NFFSVPSSGRSVIVIRSVKMNVFEKESFNVMIIQTNLHFAFYYRKILFMNYFVSLNIKSPIGIGRNGLECLIRFFGKSPSPFAERFVPYCIYNSNFWGVYTLQEI